MSTEPGASLPAVLCRRMLAVVTGAGGDDTAETAAGADEGDEPDGGSDPWAENAGEAEQSDARDGLVWSDGSRDARPPYARTAAEIMTPEERVVRLVARSGGRIRQADLVDAVEWSESTVSRRLSALEDDGAITRYRIGRENLVFLPGSEPDALGSPWREADPDAPRA